MRHRDDVAAERFGRRLRDRAERVEHIADRRRCLQPGWNQRPRIRQLADEELQPLRFVPLRVRTEPERARDGIERFGVPVGRLANVDRRKRDAKRRDAPQDVRQSSTGDQSIAGFNERGVTELQRFEQLLSREEHIGSRIPNPESRIPIPGSRVETRFQSTCECWSTECAPGAAARGRVLGRLRHARAVRRSRQSSRARRAAPPLPSDRVRSRPIVRGASRVCVTSGVTFGLPSRSPPIHDPKRTGEVVERQGLPVD